VFLCHPCIADVFVESERRKEVNRLNHSLFRGAPVISIPANGGLVINTDYLMSSEPIIFQPGMPYVPPTGPYSSGPTSSPSQQPPIAVAYTINSEYGYPPPTVPTINSSAGNSVYPPVEPVFTKSDPMAMSQPLPQTPQRLMQVVIPEGARGGDSITVISPENQRIVAIIPHHLGPGMTFQISY